MDVEMKVAGSKKRKKSPKKSFKKVKFNPPAVQKGTNMERKWVDTGAVQSAFTSAGVLTLLNGLTRGTDSYQRVARRVKLVRVNVRGHIQNYQAGAAPGADYLRAFLVYDRESNGATPALSDILQDTTSAGATSTSAYSQVNINNADRFAIVKEWLWGTIHQSNVGGGSTGVDTLPTLSEVPFKYSKKLDLDTRFNSGNAGTSADITTGALYLVTCGIQSAANAQYALNIDCRVRFVDA